MTDGLVWLITGAGRGMGVDIARAALEAGHRVVATARDGHRAAQAIGERDALLTVDLDITDTASVAAAVVAAMDRFGRIDVLVNNAGTFQAGYFEELSPEQFRPRWRQATAFSGCPPALRSTSDPSVPPLRLQEWKG
jgi:NAD(P)-dependent dehydrogenase (short-subunit alcohol dehydrogenase family)